jgi:hypothetical protein
MADGSPAPDKRIGFFASSNSEPVLTDEGRQLLAAALAWMLGEETKVDPDTRTKPPRQFVLRQNYPNPFNPATTISYSLPQSETVQLFIFNPQGRLVRNLVDSQVGAGQHHLEWDATDNTGIQVASGVYIYKLVAGRFSAQGKMQVLR